MSSNPKSITALVNPLLLIWAREVNGFTAENISKSFPKIYEWEKGSVKPTIKDVRGLAELYDQPLAVFWLSSPPQRPCIKRVLRWYERNGDALVGEQVLNFDLHWLQKLFGESRDSLMFECYPVSRMQARYLQRRLRRSFELDSYAYFLECDSE